MSFTSWLLRTHAILYWKYRSSMVAGSSGWFPACMHDLATSRNSHLDVGVHSWNNLFTGVQWLCTGSIQRFIAVWTQLVYCKWTRRCLFNELVLPRDWNMFQHYLFGPYIIYLTLNEAQYKYFSKKIFLIALSLRHFNLQSIFPMQITSACLPPNLTWKFVIHLLQTPQAFTPLLITFFPL